MTIKKAKRNRGRGRPKKEILLQFNNKWALGYDELQWILYHCIGVDLRWKSIAFIASHKRVLERILLEKGIRTSPSANRFITQLPETFSQWKAQKITDPHDETNLKNWKLSKTPPMFSGNLMFHSTLNEETPHGLAGLCGDIAFFTTAKLKATPDEHIPTDT